MWPAGIDLDKVSRTASAACARSRLYGHARAVVEHLEAGDPRCRRDVGAATVIEGHDHLVAVPVTEGRRVDRRAAVVGGPAEVVLDGIGQAAADHSQRRGVVVPGIDPRLVHRGGAHEDVRSVVHIVLRTADAGSSSVGPSAHRSQLTDEDRDAGIEVLSVVADHRGEVGLVLCFGASVAQVPFTLVHDDQFDAADAVRFRYRLAIERRGVEVIRRIAIGPSVVRAADVEIRPGLRLRVRTRPGSRRSAGGNWRCRGSSIRRHSHPRRPRPGDSRRRRDRPGAPIFRRCCSSPPDRNLRSYTGVGRGLTCWIGR